jgi:hypothetical protein
MRCALRCLSLVALGIVVVPVLAADLDPQKPPERVYWTGEIAGVLKKVDGTQLTLEVDVPTIQKQQNKNNGNRNRRPGNNRKKGGGNRRPNVPNYKIVLDQKDITLPVSENLVLRVLQPPSGFDDKGNIKQYTAQELRELKGPGNLPGYRGDQVALRPGQVVKLYLAPPKAAAGQNPANVKPVVVMALVVTDPPGNGKGQPKRK